MSSSSSAVTTTAAGVKRHLATLRSRIFQTAPPPPPSAPGGVRTGAKILKARLRGPSMLQYYNPRLKLSSVTKFNFGKDTRIVSNFDPTEDLNKELDEMYEEGDAERPVVPPGPGPNGGVFTFGQLGVDARGVGMEDIRETQRLMDVEARKARGKGPPKKGEQRRHRRRARSQNFQLTDRCSPISLLDRRRKACRTCKGQEEKVEDSMAAPPLFLLSRPTCTIVFFNSSSLILTHTRLSRTTARISNAA